MIATPTLYRTDLMFKRPDTHAATMPAEARGLSRDGVRLMVSSPSGHRHTHFYDLASFLRAGDVLVVNRSATLPASLAAAGRPGHFTLNLSTRYGHGLWLAEPRWSPGQQGPLPLAAGESINVAGVGGRLIAPFPGLPRLWFVQFDSELDSIMAYAGQPIRYGYAADTFPLENYQTLFATQPGSAEMPSAAYPFTQQVLDSLIARGVQVHDITLHTGVSSLEVEVDDAAEHPMYPEPFAIRSATAKAVNAARDEGRRVIAVGTTVVRALESAWDGEMVQARSGFTRLYIRAACDIHVIDGLITGLHDPVTSHLAMLYAIAGQDRIRAAYAEAIREGYLWHEFGDSHLILRRD